jgi:DNA polymerase-3 subunit beta
VKFRAEREALADAVGTAQRAVASRTGALPVLSGLRVTLGPGSVELVGSDLEMTIRVTTPVQGEGEGSAVLPARLFADILARLDGDTVTVELVGEDARIEAGRFATTLRTLSVGEFPRLPEVPENGVRVDGAALAESLRQVVPAASRDDARPILTGVLLAAHEGGLRLVATDSYRLAMRDLPGVSMLAGDQRVLVGAKGLAEVQRLLRDGDIEVFLAERDVTFRVGSADITTRLIEGEFPNYQQLIPSDYPNRLKVSRDLLGAAVNRVRLVSQSRDTAPIRIRMNPDGIELSAVAQDIGEAHESVEATFDGGELTVAFNAQFLLDGIESVGGSEIELETQDPLRPAVMRNPEAPDFLYLLMPVRIA